jgi:hypothetical protein
MCCSSNRVIVNVHYRYRVDRFLRAVQPAVWGYTLSNVFVMSRDAFLSTGKLLSHAAATKAQLLIKLSDVQLDATVLYVSHKWSSLSDPDASGDTYTQVALVTLHALDVEALLLQYHIDVVQLASQCCCVAGCKRSFIAIAL